MLFSVESASLNLSSFLKPNPYVELSVDERNSRKTDVLKSTYQPKWNEVFMIYVKPQSTLHFRVLDHSTFRKDTLIGEKKINLYQILTHYKGKIEKLELTLDLICEGKDQSLKVGELVTLFDGLKIETNERHSAGASGLSVTPIGGAKKFSTLKSIFYNFYCTYINVMLHIN